MDEGDLGDTPTMTAQASSGVGNGYTGGKQSPVSCLREAAAMPLPWPYGPHVAGYKYKNQNKTKKTGGWGILYRMASLVGCARETRRQSFLNETV